MQATGHCPTCCRWCCGLAVTSTACPPHMWLCDCASLGCKTYWQHHHCRPGHVRGWLSVSMGFENHLCPSRRSFAVSSCVASAMCLRLRTRHLQLVVAIGARWRLSLRMSAPRVSISRESDRVALSHRIVVVAVVLRLRLDSPSSRSASVSHGPDFNLDAPWSNLFFDSQARYGSCVS